MNKKKVILWILALFVYFAAGVQEVAETQTCNCESNFEWVKKTFEENDAGFAIALERKGEDLYQKHNAAFRKRAKAISELPKCAQMLYEWLTFFRKGHIGIILSQTDASWEAPSSEQIIKQFANWATYPYDKENFYQHLAGLQDAGMEGVWQHDIYTIGIVRQSETEYTGFIIDADSVYWRQGQVKLKIDTRKPKNTAYYMRDHTEEQFNTYLLDMNHLQVGDVPFQRLYPIYPKNDSIESYFRSMRATKPYVERISSNTLLLRVPTFGGIAFGREARREIDSVIATNKNLITSTKNLIIDIRDNSGGDDKSFTSILPLLYTNPIRNMWLEHLSTKLNNQRMLDFAEKVENKRWYKQSYDTLENHLGQFVNLLQKQVVINKLDKIYTYPKNVGVIINNNNASAAEEFILEARQSKKVKLFGTQTAGMIDISNMYFVNSPCNEFRLGYCLTKRLWLPDVSYDDVGIPPDYYIDKSIPPHKWVDFVREVLEVE